MNKIGLKITAGISAATIAIATAGCTMSQSSQNYEKREQAQQESVNQGETLEKRNLKERKKRESDPTRIGYVYLVNFGKPFGYYVIKGKVSSSGSQVGPEQIIACDPKRTDACGTVDSTQDDDTYGEGDPGIFFFLSSGAMVETTIDYIYSDEPLLIEVPLLRK